MPLPGGSANKFGNHYEQCWTVRQLLRLIDGQVTSMRIEDPTLDKAEFVITTESQKERHQAKRSHPSGKWSLSVLGSDRYQLLQAIFKQLSETSNTKFIFVSSSDAPELRELTERARDAINPKEFISHFISGERWESALVELKQFWNNTGNTTAYKILQRIKVRTIDEKGIEDDIRSRLSACFLTDQDKIYDALSSFVNDSIHQRITPDDLKSYLDNKGFRFRRLAKPEDARSLIAEVTERYVENTQRRLIRNALIHRPETQELFNKIVESTSEKGIHCVVTGKAGGGKTGSVMQCIDTLRRSDNRFTILAFRLDRVGAPQSTRKLGEALGLEESPVFVLGTAAKATSTEAVLIIDQLDAVSTTSGRNSLFFDVVEDLLKEARGWHNSLRFHVIVACRMFDWENDHRLRRLLVEDHAHVNVGDFSDDHVKSILKDAGFNDASFTAKELGLLCLPQNLSLFLDTNHKPGSSPGFSSTKELFDDYWKEKRTAVNRRAAPCADRWHDVIRLLCNEMSASQQLSVLKEKLDQFPNEYIEQMASENVLFLEKDRFGFGHETFFDYCFARNFVAQEESLTTYLLKSEQHLFRRAQVRQVLVYLRDADRKRYCSELNSLLQENRIRGHLKELAIALAFDMPRPQEDEWAVFAHWLESEIEAIKNGQPNKDKFATLVWRQFRISQSWFQLADSRGVIIDWLGSGNDYLIDNAVDYIRIHQSHSGDRAAGLLEPFITTGGKWPQRFNHIMQWADHGNSREFFDQFLRLIDDGTLDNARGPIAVNSDFWSMLHGMKKHPELVPEIVAHRLARQLSSVSNKKDGRQWRNLLGHSSSGAMKLITASAHACPDEFVRHVLPIVIKVTEQAVTKKDSSPPRRDSVWPILVNSRHQLLAEELLREALASALERLAERGPDNIRDVIEQLRTHDTYMANFFLLRTYTAGAKYFADEAAVELCDKPWRFNCGYSDTSYWVAMELIEAIAPVCSDNNRIRLEKTILDYVPKFERSHRGYRSRGKACFMLLSALPVELRSEDAKRRFQELERKFGEAEKFIRPPEKIEAKTVSSPIEYRATEKMTDEQWLRAIKQHDTDDINWQHPGRGGASELAMQIQECLKQEPERFSRIVLKLPADANPVYMARILSGLTNAQVSTEMKLSICRKAYAESREHNGRYLADALGSVKDTLPDDAIEMLEWLATKHPDPGERSDIQSFGNHQSLSNSIIFTAINTTRGSAVEAIRDQIRRNAAYKDHFHDTVEQLVKDKNLPVRALTCSLLRAIAIHHEELALNQFMMLVDPQRGPDDELILTNVYDFLHHSLSEHFKKLQPVIERMLHSDIPETNQQGAMLASLAVLYQHYEADDLVEEAMHGKPSQRLGVAEVTAANVGYEDYRNWAIPKLTLFFNDSDDKVRNTAAGCFRHLENQPLEPYTELINIFCDSKAFKDDSLSILSALKDTTQKLPGTVVHNVCTKFIERFSIEAMDLTQDRYASVPSLTEILFRAYHQNQQGEWGSRYLDVIDQLCLSGIHQIAKDLDEYERK